MPGGLVFLRIPGPAGPGHADLRGEPACFHAPHAATSSRLSRSRATRSATSAPSGRIAAHLAGGASRRAAKVALRNVRLPGRRRGSEPQPSAPSRPARRLITLSRDGARLGLLVVAFTVIRAREALAVRGPPLKPRGIQSSRPRSEQKRSLQQSAATPITSTVWPLIANSCSGLTAPASPRDRSHPARRRQGVALTANERVVVALTAEAVTELPGAMRRKTSTTPRSFRSAEGAVDHFSEPDRFGPGAGSITWISCAVASFGSAAKTL